ncbi:MAG: VWA domain-containing protein [Burkholderiaceae bacterium]
MQHRIVDNVVHFGRTLRRAGIAVGSDRIIHAVQALEAVDIGRRDEVRAALATVLLTHRDQREVFHALFEAFWRDPKLLERMMHMALPTITARDGEKTPGEKMPRRAADALRPTQPQRQEPPPMEKSEDFDVLLGHSERERLQKADFETMTEAEFRAAQQAAGSIELMVPPVRVRRRQPAAQGAIDLRRTLRRQTRTPHLPMPARSAACKRLPRVVVLLDVSGSMERYARVFLHFAHGLTRRDPRTQTLAFGTRLTYLSRSMRISDPDHAMAEIAELIPDWNAGTRIATNLTEFNRRWARRLLTGNATLLLVTDGLDRDDNGELSREAARLSRYAHRLVWLNPLLRYEGFEPKAAGIRALIGHVDQFLPLYNLENLQASGAPWPAEPWPAESVIERRNGLAGADERITPFTEEVTKWI